MKKRILLISCLIIIILILSSCHLGNNLVAEPMPTLEPTPVVETVVQTPAPTPTLTPVQTPAPAPEPTPQPTPTPFTPTPVPGPAVLITKKPSSESLTIGGRTWFIAHAENAYSLTWELVDPNGNIHSVSDAMAQHPGLLLEVLEGDTIAVSNVPLSLNGWGVQARFDGQGNSATTSPAYIYVGDFINAYSSVIEEYRYAKQIGFGNYSSSYNTTYQVSEYVRDCAYVGYALKDLDKNGIPELLISGEYAVKSDAEYLNTPVLYSVWTLVDNQPVRLFTSWARIRFYLMTDNRIYHESSGGAAYSYFEFFKVSGDHLEFLEGYATSNDYDNTSPIMYHSSTWNGETEEFSIYGDYNNPDFTIPFSDYDSFIMSYRSQCWMPQLTKIA